MSDTDQNQSGSMGDTGGTGVGAGDQGSAGGDNNQQASWIEGLSDDLKGNDVIKGYKDPGELAKAHLETLGKVPVVPSSEDEYKGQVTLPQDFPGDENFETMTRVWAKEAGLTKEQYKVFGTKYVEAQAGMMKELSIHEQRQWDAFKLDAGSRFDEMCSTAERAARQFGAPEMADMVKNKKIDPYYVKFLNKIGQSISPDSIGDESRGSQNQIKRDAAGRPLVINP